MHKLAGIGLTLVLVGGYLGCVSAGRPHEALPASLAKANPLPRLPFNNDPTHFQFAILADRCGGNRPGIFEDGIRKLNLLEPEFVMSVGDYIEGHAESEPDLDRQWNEVDGKIAKLEMPLFRLPGNHDAQENSPGVGKVAKWQQRLGPLYYHFVYGNVLFLCLDTEDTRPARISDEQVAYVKKTLAENKNVRWTLVFMHKPLWTNEGATGWEKVEPLLQDRPYTVFAGHTHDYMKYTRLGRAYIVVATTGGSSKLQGPAAGEIDEVVWVTMTDNGPRVANLALNGIYDEDFRTAPAK